ncbi:SUF system Fe-S cluster assembly protein [Martelella mediterranea]|uniref:FeS assembly SUF system protein n=1 Tax=Martelella mediterranea TaxID=293089 RepID=A0A4R3NZ65_9HYPH|nr:SUF system Fe-S cluster assembly protein [Martelella mediterranea]TCT40880.1 FeS assembly SUF system protein [Martelella mediterranea]
MSVEETENQAANAPAESGSAIPPEELARLSDDIVSALKTVYDPEIPADIFELGLIYKIDIDDNRFVKIDMTLTAPGCPVAGEMPIWVENAVSMVEGVSGAEAIMTFDPPWTPDRMSEEAKIAVGWY